MLRLVILGCLVLAGAWSWPASAADSETQQAASDPGQTEAVADSAAGAAIITALEGEVRILPKARGDVALTADEQFKRYYVGGRDAELGMEVADGSVIVTRADARVRLVFADNGDAIVLGPKSVFKLSRPGAGAPGLFELVRGVVRTWISPKGPRAGAKVRTRTQLMGVRGTEFVVEAVAKTKVTKLTVLRGKVSLKNLGSELLGVEIAHGETALIQPQAEAPKTSKSKASTPTVWQTVITTTTTVEIKLLTAPLAMGVSEKARRHRASTAKALKKIADLEQRALASVMRDLIDEEPALAQQLKKKKPKTLDEMQKHQDDYYQARAPAKAQTLPERPLVEIEDAPPAPQSGDVEEAEPVIPPPSDDGRCQQCMELTMGAGVSIGVPLIFAHAGLNFMNTRATGVGLNLGLGLSGDDEAFRGQVKPVMQSEVDVLLRAGADNPLSAEFAFGVGGASYTVPNKDDDGRRDLYSLVWHAASGLRLSGDSLAAVLSLHYQLITAMQYRGQPQLRLSAVMTL